MLKYLRELSVDPSTIKEGDTITFTLSNGIVYVGTIVKHHARKGYYVSMRGGNPNDKIFTSLGIAKNSFVRRLVGYSSEGIWPETYTLEDLGKVLNALLEVNRPVEEPVIEEPKKSSSHSKWDWLLG